MHIHILPDVLICAKLYFIYIYLYIYSRIILFMILYKKLINSDMNYSLVHNDDR